MAKTIEQIQDMITSKNDGTAYILGESSGNATLTAA